MGVIPDEFLNLTAAALNVKSGRTWRHSAFTVRKKRSTLPFDCGAYGRKRVANPKRGTHLLKPSQPVRMKGMPDREGTRVYGEDGLDAIRQGGATCSCNAAATALL